MTRRVRFSSPVSRLTTGGSVLTVGFVLLAVVALAVVPIYLGRKENAALAQISEVLDPARLVETQLSLVQARQMAALQAYLLTGGPAYRIRYLSTVQREGELYTQLTDLVKDMDLDVRKQLVDLADISNRWHLGHQEALNSDEVRRSVARANFGREQQRFAELQGATLDLEKAIQGEVDAGRDRIENQRALQTRVTFGLLLLALGATFMVGLVGRWLHVLTKEAEERRNEAVSARRENEALLEATADGVLGIDLGGLIMSVNRAGSDMLGYTENELRSHDFHEFLHHTTSGGEPRTRDSSAILGALEGGGDSTVSGEDVLWCRDGSALPVNWSLRPLVDGIEVRGAVLTFTDMTEIRENENALRRAVRVREEVVSVVSHDLRNPLGVVAGAADLLLDLPLDEPERQKQARIIRRSAQRMARLIENLLDIARIEAGALVVRPTVESPGGLLEEVRQVFQPQAEALDLDLRISVAPGTPAAMVDADRVNQALSNLVANAIKFTPAGGSVELTASPDGVGWVAFAVKDTGPGIPESIRDRLFDRFWQASRHDRTGSGLGLAIVRGIAEAHGGSVEVSASPEKGAMFTLRLPAADGIHRVVPAGSPEGRANSA